MLKNHPKAKLNIDFITEDTNMQRHNTNQSFNASKQREKKTNIQIEQRLNP